VTMFTKIYVRLLDENVDVWRPVCAMRLRDDIYRILDQPYDFSVESWEFEPGDEVSCNETESISGHRLTAIRKVGHFTRES
jgi:hypothetical protein